MVGICIGIIPAPTFIGIGAAAIPGFTGVNATEEVDPIVSVDMGEVDGGMVGGEIGDFTNEGCVGSIGDIGDLVGIGGDCTIDDGFVSMPDLVQMMEMARSLKMVVSAK